MMTQTTAQPATQVPILPTAPPPFQGDSIFWSILAIAILAKVIVGYPTEPRK
ncbi:MAG TPA: hypothetical protein V6D26_25585 [Stenomitos sp.]